MYFALVVCKDIFHYNSRFWSHLKDYNLPGGMTLALTSKKPNYRPIGTYPSQKSVLE